MMLHIETNMKQLRGNAYPGRGMVFGQTPDREHAVQVYWLTGRSENSRNRIFVEENGCVRTEAFEPANMTDPSLIIYYPVKSIHGYHIVSNGDQTETIYQALSQNKSFASAIYERTFEPDQPNYTPRISGVLHENEPGYTLAIVKSDHNNPEFCQRHFFTYPQARPGVGHCLHTYQGEGQPLPSFTGEPYEVELFNSIDKVSAVYWDLLNSNNRISLLVKFIHLQKKIVTLKIINAHVR